MYMYDIIIMIEILLLLVSWQLRYFLLSNLRDIGWFGTRIK